MIYDDLILELGDPMRDEITHSAAFDDWDFIPAPSFQEVVDKLVAGNQEALDWARWRANAELTLRQIAGRDDTETFDKITEEVNVNDQP